MVFGVTPVKTRQVIEAGLKQRNAWDFYSKNLESMTRGNTIGLVKKKCCTFIRGWAAVSALPHCEETI